MASRPILAVRCGLAALPLFALLPAGCHSGGVGNLAARPEPTLPKVSLTAHEAIRRHNVNASRVQALVASPSIVVNAPGMPPGKVDGRMAMERPRNFKLEMFRPGISKSTIADIGSNDERFWYWTTGDKKDNAVYVCSYDDLERAPISAAFQPDFVIEAMGLRAISRDEAEKMVSKPGESYGTTELTSTRRTPGGEVLTKKTIIDASGRLIEHKLYGGENKTPLAYASVSEYKQYPDPKGSDEPISLPSRFKLYWIPERLTLDITLDGVKLNQPLDDDQRQARFSEPHPSGARRLNLADLVPATGGPSPRASAEPADDPDSAPLRAPRTRTSRAIPPAGSAARARPDVQLGVPEPANGPEPQPLGVEGARRTPRDPVSLSADLTDLPRPRALDSVVRPGIPRPGDR